VHLVGYFIRNRVCKPVQKLQKQLTLNMRFFLQGDSVPRNLHNIYSVLVKDGHESIHQMALPNFKAHFVVSYTRKGMAEQRLRVLISLTAVSFVSERFHRGIHIWIISILGFMNNYHETLKCTNQRTVLLKQCGIGERFYQLLSFAAFQL